MKWDCKEGDLALEAKILDFMKDSKNRDAIANRGGWLSLGWDLSDEDEEEQENVSGLALTLRFAAATASSS